MENKPLNVHTSHQIWLESADMVSVLEWQPKPVEKFSMLEEQEDGSP